MNARTLSTNQSRKVQTPNGDVILCGTVTAFGIFCSNVREEREGERETRVGEGGGRARKSLRGFVLIWNVFRKE